MARLPRGIRAKQTGESIDEHGNAFVNFELQIAWWAWPGLFLKALRDSHSVRWYEWPAAWFFIVVAWVDVLWQQGKRRK